MTKEYYDGGAAFPSETLGDNGYNKGMTLWDLFAAHALSGLCANTNLIYSDTIGYAHEVYAKHAGLMADAMIAEREKRGVK